MYKTFNVRTKFCTKLYYFVHSSAVLVARSLAMIQHKNESKVDLFIVEEGKELIDAYGTANIAGNRCKAYLKYYNIARIIKVSRVYSIAVVMK